MFEHDHGIRALGDRRAGHDFERGSGFEPFGGQRFAGAENTPDGKPVAGVEFGTLDGVAIAGGAVKGREIAVGTDGFGENPMKGFEEREVLGFSWCGGEALGFPEDEAGGFGVSEDHVVIVRLGALCF
jgi:hypothetical protein